MECICQWRPECSYISTLPNCIGVTVGITYAKTLFDGRQRAINQRRTITLLKVTGLSRKFHQSKTTKRNNLLEQVKAFDQRAT